MKWEWGKDQETAFHNIQKVLASTLVLGHPMHGHPFRAYLDTSDIAVGACLQQVQPICLGDMKGTKIHDFTLEAHQRGLSIPQIAKLALAHTPDVPPPGQWAQPLEDTMLQVE